MSTDQTARAVRLITTSDRYKDYLGVEEAATIYAECMQDIGENDFTEWTDDDILDEFVWWYGGSRIGPEDDGGPKQEWIDSYWGEAGH